MPDDERHLRRSLFSIHSLKTMKELLEALLADAQRTKANSISTRALKGLLDRTTKALESVQAKGFPVGDEDMVAWDGKRVNLSDDDDTDKIPKVKVSLSVVDGGADGLPEQPKGITPEKQAEARRKAKELTNKLTKARYQIRGRTTDDNKDK